MSDYVDLKYIRIIGNRLEHFVEKSPDQYNFRCPFCGDSKKSKTKARGYLYEKDSSWFFRCFNCGHTTNLYGVIKYIDSPLSKEYTLEKFRSKETNRKPNIQKRPAESIPESIKGIEGVVRGSSILLDTSLLDQCISIDTLPLSSPFKQYVLNRKIPEKYWDRIFYCPDYKALVNKLIPEKLGDETISEERLVFPFFDEKGKMTAMTGRSFKTYTKLRYMMISLDKTKHSYYGLERWDKTKEGFVVEGPIDSLFLDNCIAASNADLGSGLSDYKANLILVPDNELESSKAISDFALKYIDEGFRLCIWPKWIKGKDINDMILLGMKASEIEEVIRKNSYSGLRAKIELASRK